MDTIIIVGLVLWLVWAICFFIKEVMKSIWKERKQLLIKRKIQASQSDRNPEVEAIRERQHADISLDVKRSLENIYENPEVVELANLCKMGDIIAMMDMAYFFRNCCTEQLQQLLDAYEQESKKENEDLIRNHIKEHFHEEYIAKAYMMWLVRAALYGNEKAGQLIERCPYYKKEATISYDMLTDWKHSSMKIWASNFLWKSGFIDMVRGYEDCGLSFQREKSFFEFWYVDRYCPADEDGFGAEWDYESVYYNEFFCRVPVKSIENTSYELLILEKMREQYWNNPKHNAPERKYRRRLCVEG